MRYEYRVVPAPERGEKVKGVKSAEGRFAAAVERIMNDMAARGWEYQRSDTLPSEERAGLTATQTVWRNLLIFRRPSAQDAEIFQPRMLEPPLVLAEPMVAAQSAVAAAQAPVTAAEDTATANAVDTPQPDAAAMAKEPPAPTQAPGPEAAARPNPFAALQGPSGPRWDLDDGSEEPDADGVGLFEDLDSPAPAALRPRKPRADEFDNGVENTGTVVGLPGALRARAERLRSADG